MNRIVPVALAIALAAACVGARAAPAINACVDPDGHSLYGDDTARGQCKDSPTKRLNPDASPEDLIPAPLTPEERKVKEKRDRKLGEGHRQNEAQRHKDEALLDRYPSEDDLQDARYDALGEQVRRVNEANDRMKEIIARGKDLIEQSRFFAPPHRMPANLRSDREANDQLVRRQIRVIEDAADEIERINDRFDAELKRYRQLVNGTAAMACDVKE